jgi:hypothetical protein
LFGEHPTIIPNDTMHPNVIDWSFMHASVLELDVRWSARCNSLRVQLL